MAGLFKSLKRLFTGDVLKRLDLGRPGGQKMSLRLKRERSSGTRYVVMVTGGGGSSFYSIFEMAEWDEFINAAENIRAAALMPGPPRRSAATRH